MHSVSKGHKLARVTVNGVTSILLEPRFSVLTDQAVVH